MAQDPGARRLDAGDDFPRLSVDLLGGERVTLPDQVMGHWSVVLFNRGHW